MALERGPTMNERTEAAPAPDRLLRRKEVETMVGLRKTAIYAAMRDGTFPAPVRIGARAVAWKASAVTGWIERRTEGSLC